MSLIIWIVSFIIVIGLNILKDWLIYRLRGRVQPDRSDDKNPPVITGPEDARAQRLIDLYFKERKKED